MQGDQERMKQKISFNDYKNIQSMSFNEFNRWLRGFYKAAYSEGLNDQDKDTMDLTFIAIAIKSTEGVGEKTYSKIMNNINKLCFGEEKG